MGEAVHVPGAKDEAAAQLERIFAEFVLSEAGEAGALPGGRVIGTEDVEDVRFAQPRCLVHRAGFVDQQREGDAGLLAEMAGIVGAAQSDRDYIGTFFPEPGFVVAQLRDVLAAEDSTPVAQKDHRRWPVRPQGTQADGAAVGVG